LTGKRQSSQNTTAGSVPVQLRHLACVPEPYFTAAGNFGAKTFLFSSIIPS